MEFMRGRYGEYGPDDLGRFTLWTGLVLLILTMFIRSPVRVIFDLLWIADLAFCWFRLLSRDHAARRRENQKFLSATARLRRWFNREKTMMSQRKEYHFYSCPGCGQKIRMPRGKGRVEITCPKCGQRFIKNA